MPKSHDELKRQLEYAYENDLIEYYGSKQFPSWEILKVVFHPSTTSTLQQKLAEHIREHYQPIEVVDYQPINSVSKISGLVITISYL